MLSKTSVRSHTFLLSQKYATYIDKFTANPLATTAFALLMGGVTLKLFFRDAETSLSRSYRSQKNEVEVIQPIARFVTWVLSLASHRSKKARCLLRVAVEPKPWMEPLRRNGSRRSDSINCLYMALTSVISSFSQVRLPHQFIRQKSMVKVARRHDGNAFARKLCDFIPMLNASAMSLVESNGCSSHHIFTA